MKKVMAAIGELASKKQECCDPNLRKGNGSVNNGNEVKITIDVWPVVKILLIISLFFVASQIFVQLQSIVIMTAISLFLAMGLSPALDALEKRKIPRPLAILILYIIFLGALAILFVQVIPIIARELMQIAFDFQAFLSTSHSDIPMIEKILEPFRDGGGVKNLLSNDLINISQNLQSFAGSTFDIVTSLFQSLFNFIFTITLLFFILLEREAIGEFGLALFPEKSRQYVMEKGKIIQKKMAEWFRGQIILMVAVGLGVYIGMKILEFSFGMPYAATIAIFSGFMELFPYIGLILVSVLAGIIALNVSWLVFFLVLGWIFLIQFLEGNILVPVVMEKVVGLSAVVTILALAIGGILGNAAGGVPMTIVGMIFSIPVAASVSVFIHMRNKESKQA